MPRHVNPISPNRTATAPYNFVPLPERVFQVADGIEVGGKKIKPWEMHDYFVPGTFSGYIELSIETLTPLFIRGTVGLQDDGAWDDRPSRLRPDPYMTQDGRPAIPGSSLRGMVRTLVEILTFSKIQPMSQARPFFRDISPSRISTQYRQHFVEDLGQINAGIDIGSGQPVSQHAPGYRSRVRAGILRLTDRTIRECGFARIEQSLIRTAFGGLLLSGSGPMAIPNWSLQNSRIWVRADSTARDYFFRRKTTTNGRLRHPDIYLRFRKIHSVLQSRASGHQSGLLVITGGIPNKHLEFVFLDSGEGMATIKIPEGVWDRFHDDDQITNWQERAFPQDRPQGVRRKAPGHLRDGEPVFFLVDDRHKSDENPDGLVFLGRAGMFRFPYDRTPEELIPEGLRRASTDLSEVMFGKVDAAGAIKGRVRFEDAVASVHPPANGWFESVVVPRILSAPKPTTFQHYLTQDGTKSKDQLTTYLDGDKTTIRGHKIYWHRWENGGDASQIVGREDHQSLLHDLQQSNPDDTQHTLIRPVKAGVAFAGLVRFENLTELELGALLHALQLPEGCAHRLGMGKPLGLGSIRISVRLKTIDRIARYRAWQSTGLEEADGNRFGSVFLEAILSHARTSGETFLNGQTGLRQIARLDALFRLLEWANRPSRVKTEYMQPQSFRDRPVLPTPHGVAGLGEPPWPPDAPRPALDNTVGNGTRGGRLDRVPVPPDAATDTTSRQRQVPTEAVQRKPIQTGQTRSGTLKRSGTGWVAVFEGDDREARIVNVDKIDSNCSEGTTAEFYIMEQSKRVGIRCRFERVLRAS